MDQGHNSFVVLKDGRVNKYIHERGPYGSQIDPYHEYKILNYVQHFGPEFPQNVKCDGKFQLSYDYVPGVTLSRYINTGLSVRESKNILLQIFKIYHKLEEYGIRHGDFGLQNFVRDSHGVIHILDFGFAYLINHEGIISTDFNDDIHDKSYSINYEDFGSLLSDIIQCYYQEDTSIPKNLRDILRSNVVDFTLLTAILS